MKVSVHPWACNCRERGGWRVDMLKFVGFETVKSGLLFHHTKSN